MNGVVKGYLTCVPAYLRLEDIEVYPPQATVTISPAPPLSPSQILPHITSFHWKRINIYDILEFKFQGWQRCPPPPLKIFWFQILVSKIGIYNFCSRVKHIAFLIGS